MATPSIKATHLYSYQNDVDGELAIIATASDQTGIESISNDVVYWNAFGIKTSIFTLSIAARAPRSVNSRDYQFFVDNILADTKKWHLDNGASKWGIDAPTQAITVAAASGTGPSGTQGPSSATVGTPTTPNTAGWENTNPGLTGFRTHPVGSITQTNYIAFTGFGFSIPDGAIITGIELNFVYVSQSSTTALVNNVSLFNAGAAIGTFKNPNLPIKSVTQQLNLGSFSDVWGATLTPAIVNSSTFGFGVQYSFDGVRLFVEATFEITVFYTLGTNNPIGFITLNNGRRYFQVYENSTTVHFSDLNPISASTGPVTNGQVLLNNIQTSPDGQVDKSIILATADGGNPTVLFLLTSLSNGTATFTDNIPEATLVLNNVY